MTKELCNSLFLAPQRSPSFCRHHPLCDFGAERAGSRCSQRGLSEPRVLLGPAPPVPQANEKAQMAHSSQWGPGSQALPPRARKGGSGPGYPLLKGLTWWGSRPWPSCGRSGTCRSPRSAGWAAPRRHGTSPCSAGSRRSSWCPSRPRWWGP